jgi:predicted GNAT family N-acyltransferase
LKIKQISAAQTWSLRQEVMWPEMPIYFVKLPLDDKGNHFGFYSDQELISVVSLFQTDVGVAQFRKLATKKEEQGKGYGSKLLLHLISFAQKKDIHTIWCNARMDKIDFYKKFGMIATKETFEKENIKFVILKKVF